MALRLGRLTRIARWQIAAWPDLPVVAEPTFEAEPIADRLANLLHLTDRERDMLRSAAAGLPIEKQRARLRAMFLAGMRSPAARVQIPQRVQLLVFERDGHRCQYCGKAVRRGSRSIDHRVPVSWGGSHDESNLVTACRSCNSEKGARVARDLECGHLGFGDYCRWKACR